MIKFFVLFLVSCFSLPLSCLAQILVNKPSDIFIGEIVFNKSFIRDNKIKCIRSSLSLKPDNEIIVDKGLVECYDFDELGNLSRYYYTAVKNSEAHTVNSPAVYKRGKKIREESVRTEYAYTYDTVFTCYYYDKEDRLHIKRTNAGLFYDAFYYDYDLSGNLIKETHCRETNSGKTSFEFKLGVQTILSVESFEYVVQSKTQVKKKCLNDEGRVYKEAIINYNDNRNKTEENYEFIVSGLYMNNAFKYDSLQRLMEKKYIANTMGNQNEQSVFEYDNNGNLLSEQKFWNAIKTNEINYLYDEKFKFLKSLLNRDFINKTIGIVKYSYVFYE